MLSPLHCLPPPAPPASAGLHPWPGWRAILHAHSRPRLSLSPPSGTAGTLGCGGLTSCQGIGTTQPPPRPGQQVCPPVDLLRRQTPLARGVLSMAMEARVPLPSRSQCLIKVPGNPQRRWSSMMGQSHLEIHRPLPGDSVTALSVVGRAHVLSEMGASRGPRCARPADSWLDASRESLCSGNGHF